MHGVVACPFAPGPISFKAPEYPYGAHGPLVNALALVGNHVLVFTDGF